MFRFGTPFLLQKCCCYNIIIVYIFSEVRVTDTIDNQRLRRLKDKANKLPKTPGVYIMRNSQKEIIYIGKAKALKNRVTQYFGAQHNHLPKVRKMVENVADFDYILTDSEFEALVLECSLIKQNMPKYNILLKDDKGYSYIKITNGKYKNIKAVFQNQDDGCEYLGPYTGNYSVTKAVDEAKKIYKLPTCNKVFPRDIKKERPCLNAHLDLCCAVCSGKVSESEYNERVSSAIEFLKLGKEDTVKNLKAEMERAAEELNFEKAAKLRDTIRGIEKVKLKQKVVSSTYKEQDVFAVSVLENKACFAVLRFSDNQLTDSEHFFVDETESEEVMRAELILSYYTMNRTVPPRIETDGDVEGKEDIEKYLSEKRKSNVSIVVPQKGEQMKLVAMCKNNATQKLLEKHTSSEKTKGALEELSLMLGLKNIPEYIESYDISHTSGSDNVAGMIVFKDGKPLKKAYRRFSIKGFSGQDDYASMNEVLRRRFTEYKEHQGENDEYGFSKLPDLILLDGGKGQVNAVLPLLREFELDIPVFGMVKDNKHKTSAISTGGGRIEFNSKRKAFTLVTQIQDEVHRFAIEYHRKKHTKSALQNSLTKINGIGEKKAKNLIIKFKTIENIGKASEEELSFVQGITKDNAKEIYKTFHGE